MDPMNKCTVIAFGCVGKTVLVTHVVCWSLLIYCSLAVDKIKEKHEVDPKKKAKKKKEEDRIVKDLTVAQQKLSGLNIRSTLLMAATMIGLFWGLNSYYSGIVVAKLPFEPISIVRSLAHRNLSGDDVTVSAVMSRHLQQCSFCDVLESLEIQTFSFCSSSFVPCSLGGTRTASTTGLLTSLC